ncbi:hypothetical protein SAMN04487950_3711 [Halogranum rubrum]|uniref:Uncharacterized protein n=1 Tax=Halogranum rubrum TaxID=553466 RepID=A0A1I4HHK4_9EURY|nr:hypothetical protein [Halogranum rubrum]SFL41240.1 hypothetical protein SAMN04487950_3711 [Halogranum rubrum]
MDIGRLSSSSIRFALLFVFALAIAFVAMLFFGISLVTAFTVVASVGSGMIIWRRIFSAGITDQ